MTKTIVRKNVLSLTLSVLISLTEINLCSASNLDPFVSNTYDLLEAEGQPIPKQIDKFSPNTYDLLRQEERQQKYLLKKRDEEEKIECKPWRFYGNFSEIQNHSSDIPLNHQFYAKLYHYTSNIQDIGILGYRDGNITISVDLKKKDSVLYQKLLHKNLLEDDFPLISERFLRSRNTDELDKFLNALVEENVIPLTVRKRILKEIKLQNPKPINWQKKLRNLSKVTSDQYHTLNTVISNGALNKIFKLKRHSTQEE